VYEKASGWPAAGPPEPAIDLELGRGVLDRILCGVDSGEEGLEAIRQAERLREPDGRLALVTALELATASHAGFAAVPASEQLAAEARAALDAGQALAPGAPAHLVEGRADQVLLEEAVKTGATLLAVGSHGISRPVGIAVGSVTTTLLHSAPCSVLVARGRSAPDSFPGSILVGIDGSAESELAAAVAFRLGKRLGVEVWPLAARGGKDFDIAAVDAMASSVLIEEGHPVDALVAGAERAGLLVVGSRGLHGLRALGSVSERVAHQAPCSVLVVRRPPA
jgi:nucleotide-binding universal stress UspA family protein